MHILKTGRDPRTKRETEGGSCGGTHTVSDLEVVTTWSNSIASVFSAMAKFIPQVQVNVGSGGAN